MQNFTHIGISIIVPCYNEEISLPKFFYEITQVMEQISPKVSEYFELKDNAIYELIFVNDGSRDRTLEILKDMRSKDSDYKRVIKVFSFSRNFGKEAAIYAGLQHARGEGVILLDADLQDPPSLILQMIDIWLDSNRDTKVIYARRTTRAGESKLRAVLSETFYKVSNLISDVKIESGVRDFRLMDREVINSLLQMEEYHRFSKAMFAWVGFKRKCLNYEYIPHFKESSSWSFWKLFKYAIEGIVSFSTMPLRIAFVLGFIISMCSVFFGLYRFVNTLLYGNLVPGYPSLVVIITFIGGVQLMLLGVIGEYIARIYEQVKKRPIYILDNDKELESTAINSKDSTSNSKN